MRIHPSVTVDRVVALNHDSIFDLGNPGICLECGEDAEGCEPDARNYRCAYCGKRRVFGAQEILIMVVP